MDTFKNKAKYFVQNINSEKNSETFNNYLTNLVSAMNFTINTLPKPPKKIIDFMKVDLLPKKDSRKTLFLDLDETLIHSCKSGKYSITMNSKENKEEIKFNLRPYCREFLEKISEFYEIYIFTASCQEYANPIIDFIDPKKTLIDGVLSRNCCLVTYNNKYIKDLRIIKNRNLKNVILVDNNPYSFGRTYKNCVPILDFFNNEEDRELIELEKYLTIVAGCEDVRKINNKYFQFTKLSNKFIL